MAENPSITVIVTVLRDKASKLLEFAADCAKRVPTSHPSNCSTCNPGRSGMCAECQLSLIQANARLVLVEVGRK